MKKVNYRNLSSQLSLLLLAILLAFSTSTYAQDSGDVVAGESLYKANCVVCHKLDKKGIGPALRGVADKFDRDWLYKWIKDSQSLVKEGDSKAMEVFAAGNNIVMNSFPALSNEDIDNILAYSSQPKPEPIVAETTAVEEVEDDINMQNVIIGALALVFILLVIVYFFITKTLRKLAEAKGESYDGVPSTPLWKVFVQNQFLMLVSSILLLLVSGYFMFGFFMQLGVDQGYAPVQPIHYSHKIHAGDNQIDCNYCHSSARKSKTSGIPSLNICMNCHKNISEYTGPEDLANGYTTDFYNQQIAKLYDAVGWDEDDQSYTGEEKPVKWVQVHNLPDFVYFNHSQHVSVAGIECQKCHGPVEEMEVLEQYSQLTMRWCLDCHNETNIDVKGNDYYEKIHEELSKKYDIERVTASDMGGKECGKCHY